MATNIFRTLSVGGRPTFLENYKWNCVSCSVAFFPAWCDQKLFQLKVEPNIRSTDERHPPKRMMHTQHDLIGPQLLWNHIQSIAASTQYPPATLFFRHLLPSRHPSDLILFGICIIVLGRFCFAQFHWSETWLALTIRWAVQLFVILHLQPISQFQFDFPRWGFARAAGIIAHCRHYCQLVRGVPAATAESNPTKLRSFKICTEPRDNVSEQRA